MEISQKQNIFWQYLSWQFFKMPRDILRGWKNFLKFGLNYFSVFLLIKTFFSPWRRYRWTYPRGLDIGKYFETFFSNLISRILGAILRFPLIIVGCLAEIFIFFAGFIVFLGWLLLPLILILGIYHGFRILL
ncbi:MAG: hypothetical protein ACE5J0_03060 [Candidatus Paceibacterales bacterium]